MSKKDAIICVGPNGPNHGVEVFIEDMGTFSCKHDSPIYLEFNDGKWILHVWSDINQEDPTHQIDMTSALESNRSEVIKINV